MPEAPIRCHYPLHWPEGWKRSPTPKRSAFDADRTMAQAREFLLAELRRLGAHTVDISSNVQVRHDGLPRSGQAQPGDRGVAVYFKMCGNGYVLACDRWNRVEDNIYAIAKHIEAMRAQDRFGVGSREAAFGGYKALPPAATALGTASWWMVLGVDVSASVEDIREAYRQRAMHAHPDMGGSADEMAALTAARDEGLRTRGGR